MRDINIYRFKWDNTDIDSYTEGLRAKATLLRREAAILVARAEVWEDLMYRLRDELIPYKADSGDVDDE